MFVYSTNSTNVEYAQYGKAEGNAPPPVLRRVVIKGGANVANKHMITPYGVVTKVSDEDAAWLVTDPNFVRHQKAGHVRIETRNVDPEVVAADMKGRDGSAPLVESDFEVDPKTGKSKAPKVEVHEHV